MAGVSGENVFTLPDPDFLQAHQGYNAEGGELGKGGSSMSGILMLVLGGTIGQSPASEANLAPLFHAIRVVETGGETRPERAVGDGGRSRGPYQISRAYLADSGMSGDWSRCHEQIFSELVMLSYWRRHCPQALRDRDFETLARVHNGGPTGVRKISTLRYWSKVRGVLHSEQLALRNNSVSKRRGRLVG